MVRFVTEAHHAADVIEDHQRMAAGVADALRDGARRAQGRIPLTQRRPCAGAEEAFEAYQ